MVVRCPHGHENDPRNRFCEQCGARLENASQHQESSAPKNMAGTNCPSCGTLITPGEVFCDKCGASLIAGTEVPASGYDSYDAPTVYAATPPGGAEPSTEGDRSLAPAPGNSAAAMNSQQGESASAEHSVTCTTCGHPNLPGDRFCDHCGAALTDQADADKPTITSPQPAEPPTARTQQASSSDTLICSSCGTTNDAKNTFCENCGALLQKAYTPSDAAQPELSSSSDEDQVSLPAVTVDGMQQAEVPTAAGTSGLTREEEQRLQDAVTRERENVAVFEQMAARYSGNAPPEYITNGLEQARRTMADAEAQLVAFREKRAQQIATLQDIIKREREDVAMFEQMAARYSGNASPEYITNGLEQARRAVAEAEAQLATLMGGRPQPAQKAAPAAPPQAEAGPTTAPEAAPAAPAQAEAGPTTAPEAAPAAPAQAEAPSKPATPTPPAASTAAPPQEAVIPKQQIAAVLIIDNSKARIPLSPDKREHLIGREDPVSGIFPEVDLTPHGGESGGVSRQHARLTHEDDRWLLTDLESTNYTKVDGTNLQPNVPTPIKDGAKLQFGRLVTTFHLEAQ